MPDLTLPQPPPDAPAPSPGPAETKSREKLVWLLILGIGSILGLFCIPLLTRRSHSKIDDQTATVSNLRQIGLALFEFDIEYGSYPDAATAAKLQPGTSLTLGTRSSNNFFTQLLVANITQSERMFHVRYPGSVPPDGVFDTDSTALARGECVFAYVVGGSSASPLGTPVAFGPFAPGTRHVDPGSNRGKGSILRNDNSVQSSDLDAAGNIIINGMDLLDSRQPFWYGRKPEVKWPE